MNAAPTSTSSSRLPVVWILVVAGVVILGVVAVLMARSAGEEGEPVASGPVVDPAGIEVDYGTHEDAAQTGEITVTGDPLPSLDGDPDPAIGLPIPTVEGVDLAGKPVSIGADGRAKIILFVAHWCPHCQKEVPALEEHLGDSPLPEDVDLLTVSTSVTPNAENYPPSRWLQAERWWAPVLVDDEAGTAAAAFGLSGFPYFVAVDADGEVVARASGELGGAAFDALVDQLTAV